MTIEELEDTVERRAIALLKHIQHTKELTQEEQEALAIGIIAIETSINAREAV